MGAACGTSQDVVINPPKNHMVVDKTRTSLQDVLE
jgi:hypothetical protein